MPLFLSFPPRFLLEVFAKKSAPPGPVYAQRDPSLLLSPHTAGAVPHLGAAMEEKELLSPSPPERRRRAKETKNGSLREVMPGGSGKGPSGEKSPSPREGPRAVRAEGGGAVPLCRELRRREESGGSERGAVLRVRERRSVLLREKGRAARGQRGDGAGMAARALERQQPGASCGRALHGRRAKKLFPAACRAGEGGGGWRSVPLHPWVPCVGRGEAVWPGVSRILLLALFEGCSDTGSPPVFRHSAVLQELSEMTESGLALTSAHSLSTRGCIPSRPTDLCTLIPPRRSRTTPGLDWTDKEMWGGEVKELAKYMYSRRQFLFSPYLFV